MTVLHSASGSRIDCDECEHHVAAPSLSIVTATGQSQPKVSNHLACLRWCGFVATRREHRHVYYSIADSRAGELLALAHELLEDNAAHMACCSVLDAEDGEAP